MKVGLMLPQEWEKGSIDPVEAYERMTSIAQEHEVIVCLLDRADLEAVRLLAQSINE